MASMKRPRLSAAVTKLHQLQVVACGFEQAHQPNTFPFGDQR